MVDKKILPRDCFIVVVVKKKEAIFNFGHIRDAKLWISTIMNKTMCDLELMITLDESKKEKSLSFKVISFVNE